MHTRRSTVVGQGRSTIVAVEAAGGGDFCPQCYGRGWVTINGTRVACTCTMWQRTGAG